VPDFGNGSLSRGSDRANDCCTAGPGSSAPITGDNIAGADNIYIPDITVHGLNPLNELLYLMW
jgi:hypothetical protein